MRERDEIHLPNKRVPKIALSLIHILARSEDLKMSLGHNSEPQSASCVSMHAFRVATW